MATFRELKAEALAHYDRMISCAEKFPQNDFTCVTRMEESIGESWYGDDCAFCKSRVRNPGVCCNDVLINGEVVACPLRGSGMQSMTCCDKRWVTMSSTVTWGEWVKKARRVRDYIARVDMRGATNGHK